MSKRPFSWVPKLVEALQSLPRDGRILACAMCTIRDGLHEADCPLRDPGLPTQEKKASPTCPKCGGELLPLLGCNGECFRALTELETRFKKRMESMKPPNFIAFEGIDASGKETQSKMLARQLGAKLYSFPDYSTPSGQLIKRHLHQEWQVMEGTRDYDGPYLNPELDAFVFQSLMLTNRMEVADEIRTHLQAGGCIVADRYTVSGEVYGASDGLDGDYLRKVHLSLPHPDLYILLDIPVEESFRRRPNRGGDRYEEDRAKLEEVRERYLTIFKNRAGSPGSKLEGCQWIILDGTLPPEELYRQIVQVVNS